MRTATLLSTALCLVTAAIANASGGDRLAQLDGGRTMYERAHAMRSLNEQKHIEALCAANPGISVAQTVATGLGR